MPLEIIIDGYNLIRQSRSLRRLDAQSLEQGREALLERLIAYHQVRGHPITVVCSELCRSGSSCSRLRGRFYRTTLPCASYPDIRMQSSQR